MKLEFSKSLIFYFLILLVSGSCEKPSPTHSSQEEFRGYDANYSLDMKDYLQDKNFFALSMMIRLPEVRQVLLQHDNLNSFYNKRNQLSEYLGSCDAKASCLVNALIWSEEEISSIGKYFSELVESSTALRQMIDEHLRPSGFFENYKFANNQSFIKKVWNDAASGINFIMEVYVLGATPVDDDSDGPLFGIGDQTYQQEIFATARRIEKNLTDESLFFEANLQLAISLLTLNNRNEAERFEPLEEGENRVAIEKLSKINFDKFEYSVIVALGDSPNSPGDATNISEGAKYRVKIAAERYHDGKAPFILFTGANVFPNHSPFHEAIEMKKWAIKHYQIPENSILVDPHARHTTTNLRNASRQLIRYGFPLDKKGLITTSKSQSEYVTSNRFNLRCMDELGFFPVKLEVRKSELDVEFFPKINALHANSIDPLDP